MKNKTFTWVFTLSLILVSCNLNVEPEPSDLPTVVLPTTVVPPTIAPPLPPTTEPFPDPVLKIVGDEEIIFDWTNDRCADHNIPDLAFRAFRGADGKVQAILSSDNNYRMLGPDLNNLKVDCNPIMTSEYNADPSQYVDAQWVAAPYTEDGQTVYALVHNEYQGHMHPGQCPQNDYFPCWDNSITLAISTDGGETYNAAKTPPQNLVARFPYPYKAGAGPEGFRAPSNILKGKDDYYYSFFNVSEYGTQKQWVCLMRTDDLSTPDSWRFWDGTAFEGQFADPYVDDVSDPDAHICPHIDQVGNTSESLNESITYNTYLDRYVLVGISADWLDREIWGFYYSFSDDLINWTHRKLLLEIELPWTVEFPGSDVSHLYPSLLDPDSSSRNFETTDKTAYLYFTRNNFGHASLDRDLIRVPVEFFPTE